MVVLAVGVEGRGGLILSSLSCRVGEKCAFEASQPPIHRKLVHPIARGVKLDSRKVNERERRKLGRRFSIQGREGFRRREDVFIATENFRLLIWICVFLGMSSPNVALFRLCCRLFIRGGNET